MGKKLVALASSGPMSGKTYLAEHMEKEYGFIHADHSLALKKEFVRVWNDPLPRSEQITLEQVLRNREQWRPLLQQFGTTIGFSGDVPYESVKKWTLFTLAGAHLSGWDVVFEAVRDEVQAAVLRDLGFFLVQLEIDESIRRVRAEEKGQDYNAILAAMDAHPELELGIDRPDMYLDGSMPVEIQARTIFRLMNEKEGLTHG